MLYEQYCRWPSHASRGGDGVLVGADITQEWLLPWFWSHYSRHNSHPVTWVDFGLSASMKEWCRMRGELISLRICSELFVTEKEEIDASQLFVRQRWNDDHFWRSRNAWFKKPFAMLQTPYERTLWLDCDCEVRGALQELFLSCNPHGIAMRSDKKRCPELHTNGRAFVYNSGVLVYQWGHPLFPHFAKAAIEQNPLHYADDHLLTELMLQEQMPFHELSDCYNRLFHKGEKDEGAIIFHWSGAAGKESLQRYRSIKHLEAMR